MDIVHGTERVFGRLLILVGLPLFVTLYALFASHLLSASSISSAVSSLTHNSLLAALSGFWISTTGVFVAGLLVIAGAALIFLGSKDYEGLSKVGIQIVVMSVISIVLIFAVFDFVLPTLISKIGGSSGSGISGLVSTLISPITSIVELADVFFIVLGAGFIALQYLLPYIIKFFSSKTKKNQNSKHAPLFWYRVVGLPIGVVVMIVLLAFLTVFNSGLVSIGPTYQTTSIANTPVSVLYNQTNSASGAAGLYNLSDYYFLTGPNESSSFSGGITLSVSALQFSLPMSISVAKLGDPIRINFSINLAQFRSVIHSLESKSNTSLNIPSQVNFVVLYNSTGLTTCNNLNSQSGAQLDCNYTSIPENLTEELLNINSSNENHSIIGQLFSLPNLLTGIFSSVGSNSNSGNSNGSSQNNNCQNCSNNGNGPSNQTCQVNCSSGSPQNIMADSSQSTSTPTFSFVGNQVYNGNDCTLFYVNETSSSFNLTGKTCLSDSDGLPTFVDVTLNLNTGSSGNNSKSGGLSSISVNVNFGITSTNGDITLTSITSLPPETKFGNGN